MLLANYWRIDDAGNLVFLWLYRVGSWVFRGCLAPFSHCAVLILATFCFSKSSAWLHNWLSSHPTFDLVIKKGSIDILEFNAEGTNNISAEAIYLVDHNFTFHDFIIILLFLSFFSPPSSVSSSSSSSPSGSSGGGGVCNCGVWHGMGLD